MSWGILKISRLFPKPRQYVRKELSAESGSPDYFGLNVDMEVSLMTYELPLEVPLRLIGGTTDFNLYYSLYVNNVFICVIIVLSRVKFSVNNFFLSFFLTKYNIYNYVTQYSIGIFQMILLCNKCGYKI